MSANRQLQHITLLRACDTSSHICMVWCRRATLNRKTAAVYSQRGHKLCPQNVSQTEVMNLADNLRSENAYRFHYGSSNVESICIT